MPEGHSLVYSSLTKVKIEITYNLGSGHYVITARTGTEENILRNTKEF